MTMNRQVILRQPASRAALPLALTDTQLYLAETLLATESVIRRDHLKSITTSLGVIPAGPRTALIEAQLFLNNFNLKTTEPITVVNLNLYLLKPVVTGNKDACFFIGLLHLVNFTLKPETHNTFDEALVNAYSYFQRAANQGHSAANFYLGLMHETGLGIPEDKSLAVSYFMLAADKGSYLAAYKLSKIFLASPNEMFQKKGMALLSQAASHRLFYEAQFKLAKGLNKNEKNLTEVFSLLGNAAMGEYIPAQVALAEIFFKSLIQEIEKFKSTLAETHNVEKTLCQCTLEIVTAHQQKLKKISEAMENPLDLIKNAVLELRSFTKPEVTTHTFFKPTIASSKEIVNYFVEKLPLQLQLQAEEAKTTLSFS